MMSHMMVLVSHMITYYENAVASFPVSIPQHAAEWRLGMRLRMQYTLHCTLT